MLTNSTGRTYTSMPITNKKSDIPEAKNHRPNMFFLLSHDHLNPSVALPRDLLASMFLRDELAKIFPDHVIRYITRVNGGSLAGYGIMQGDIVVVVGRSYTFGVD